MSRPQFAHFWPLRLVAVLSLVGPALVFGYTTWQNHQAVQARAEERIERALDVLQEHALKSLQTVERAIAEVNEILRGMMDEEIRSHEAELYLRLKRTQQALPQIEAIWVFDKDGRPLVSSTIMPVPRNLNNSDRSYFAAQRSVDVGSYISEVVRARIGALSFFVVSGRRDGGQAGRFDGVIAVSVMPEHFNEFYRKLTRGRDTFSLFRADGPVLARFPEIQLGSASAAPELLASIQRRAESGIYTGVSVLDAIERRLGYRQVAGFPVYVATGIEVAALSDELKGTMFAQLAIGLPTVLMVFFLSLYALQRAKRFQEELSRREAAEAALKQAQRLEAIGQLTGGVAHDFNNLLMIVQGSVERIRRGATLDERGRQALEAIGVAVKRGSDLTRHLLSFSRRQAHEAKSIDLKERLPAIQAMLRSSLRGDIMIDVDLPTDIWPLKLDVSELELALLNLCVNARDAMKKGGTIVIAARNAQLTPADGVNLTGKFVAISVTDTGEGIAPEVLGRVFEPFFTTKEIGKGTGLGLSQVYGFATQAGGTARVESTLNQGTTVTLFLPRSADEADPTPAEPNSDPVTRRQVGQASVLVVEDNVEVADVTKGYLESYGYRVTVASDVTTALDALRRSGDTIDLVLTDIVMPGGRNGLDLARQLRRDRGKEFPVLLATGYSDQAQSAANEGFAILRKPYGAAELDDAIANALRPTRERELV